MNVNLTNHLSLFLPLFFGLWLLFKPNGFQNFLNFQFGLMKKFKMAPKDLKIHVQPYLIRIFGIIWVAIVIWVIIMLVANTLPVQPNAT
ncbi:hypothetical protein Meth11DRAFT_0276 [Methylophilaceae bacterium 11]|nr:hypothetical protein Meth11DRAFT_0276 [Methylophilaceae bacterium 11]